MRNVVLVAQILAVFVLVVDLIYISFQNSSKAQVHLLILTSSTIIMLIGYYGEIVASSAKEALLGTAFAYVGKPFALLATYLFIAEFCGKRFSKKWIVLHSLFSTVFPALIFTNDYHHLYYSTVEYVPSRIFSGLILGHGPLYFLYMAVVVLNFVFCLILIISELQTARTKEVRIQCIYLGSMMAVTVGGYIFFLAGLTGGYDTTMIGAFVGALLLTIMFFRYDLFDSLTLAKDKAMDGSNTGFLVVRESGALEYSNQAANEVSERAITLDRLKELGEGDHTVNGRDGLVYEIVKNRVYQKDRYFGETMEIREITEKHNYSLLLEEQVKTRTREIKQIQRSVISSFAGIIDARDSTTGTHIRNMSRYAEIIARSLHKTGDDGGELTEEKITCIVDVAPLHDIGKLSIPDSILLKPARLTDEEYAVMKTHSEQGARIIRECLDGVETKEYVRMAEDVALYHHERWDGKGYPKGLAGNDIPLSARIMAVADVYDAVRSSRVYKPPFDLLECRQIIEGGSGTQFDPKVVKAFLNSIREIENPFD